MTNEERVNGLWVSICAATNYVEIESLILSYADEIRRECAEKENEQIAGYIASVVYLRQQNKYLQDEIGYLKRFSSTNPPSMEMQSPPSCGRSNHGNGKV